jgi:hypothetical protein
MIKVILTDIDHTLAAAAWRDHLWEAGRWDDYHRCCGHDKVIESTALLVRSLYICGNTVIGITSRPSKWREITMRWMVDNGIPLDDVLMRDSEVHLKAPELKIALAEERFGSDLRATILMLIEDRDDVVSAFMARGVPCVHVRGGATG